MRGGLGYFQQPGESKIFGPVPKPPSDTDHGDLSNVIPAEDEKTRAERLKEEAMPVRHLMTHLPSNPYCPACKRAKLPKAQSRRKLDDGPEATTFGEYVTADH